MKVFNFYGIFVEISSEWKDLLEITRKDFSFFELDCNFLNQRADLRLKIFKEPPPLNKLLGLKIKHKSRNSLTYQKKHVRLNDYYGKVLTVFDYEQEFGEVYSENFEKTHEVVYLLILSRVGKKFDIRGIHKIHAFAISYHEKVFVCMMPMGGGKSTLLLELLKNNDVKLLSDDIVLIDKKLNILPMPLKIGVVSSAKIPIDINEPEKNIYTMDREFFGLKKLICLDGLPERIELKSFSKKDIYLFEGFRVHDPHTKILNKASSIKIFYGLFYHGIIGFGLPLILEYFWEFGIYDFFIKSKIFIDRSTCFFRLVLSVKKGHLLIGNNPKNAAEEIITYLDHT